ncbi:GNAT family protein [Vibrio sp. SCSIO 43136]|uniref:GNAT family N-acetyltransferase n=1 Tax=Vibrio sp. SCSIO 43136 TaxID=2819101 RepID=UPI0020764ECE|nr:GNAT family protein [Vibrio sp. SCSIO 43136]USD68308.1 GNAT family N-acetyltransferase [Vibrio sp. SCSIO 43136]
MLPIHTPRLILRNFSINDGDAYVKFTQQSKYQRFYSETDASPEHNLQLITKFVAQTHQTPRQAYQLAIEDKETGKLIGTCGLRLETDHQASVGCGVAREAQGSGVAVEAMAAMVNFGFDNLGVHRIYAETISNNIAAVRLCEQFGMRKEAHFVEHRYFKYRWWDTVIYAMRRDEWAQLIEEDDRVKSFLRIQEED